MLKGQVFRIALWGCSLNVFVCVNVFVFVFVSFVGQVISLHLSDQMSLENLYLKAFSKSICLCLSVGQFVSPMTHSDHTSQRSQVSRITKYVCLCLFVSLIMSPLHCDQTSQGQKSPWKWTMSCVCFKTKRSLTESPSIKLSWSVAGQIKTLFNWIFLQLAYL